MHATDTAPTSVTTPPGPLPAPEPARTCITCGVDILPRMFYCQPCRRKRAKDASDAYRAGLTMAPGEKSVSRRYALCGLGDVAQQFGVTRQRVQQIERTALLKLRRGLMPFVAEHDPVAYERLTKRETQAQSRMARTYRSRQLSQKQVQLISEMRRLADEYEADGQHEIAAEVRLEVADLTARLERLLGDLRKDA